MASCKQKIDTDEVKVLFLHHSTGQSIWYGDKSVSLIDKIRLKLGIKNEKKGVLPELFYNYNRKSQKNYQIKEFYFPKSEPYGWKNYPFDYYNIWVKHGGSEPFMEEPTLEMLTKDYQLIMFKHCYPVSNIQADQDSADVDSELKSVANYKLQYIALRDKLHQFSNTKFIVWTGAMRVKSQIAPEQAQRANEFFNWVTKEWDIPGDNIFIWDFYQLQTEDGLYFLDKYAESASDSHPNKTFSKFASELLLKRLIDVIENDGAKTKLTGEAIY
jgi:hypothetical protein